MSGIGRGGGGLSSALLTRLVYEASPFHTRFLTRVPYPPTETSRPLMYPGRPDPSPVSVEEGEGGRRKTPSLSSKNTVLGVRLCLVPSSNHQLHPRA